MQWVWLDGPLPWVLKHEGRHGEALLLILPIIFKKPEVDPGAQRRASCPVRFVSTSFECSFAILYNFVDRKWLL